jgi:hypothetical protein
MMQKIIRRKEKGSKLLFFFFFSQIPQVGPLVSILILIRIKWHLS